jgi:hypothetical protein
MVLWSGSGWLEELPVGTLHEEPTTKKTRVANEELGGFF